jgi:2-keto-3-deoxy-L-rhamnonate aldolase RhmA
MEDLDLRGRLARGERLAGTVVTLPDVALAELTAHLADFVWIDLEHGALGAGDIQPLAIASQGAGAATLVRLTTPYDAVLERALDAGADGVVVPRVDDAAQAARVVERLRHPPSGSRGVAARRATAYGLDASVAYAPLCLLQIESAAAVDGVVAIAAVEGVDALVVGCSDLALSLGETAPDSDAVREAITRVQVATAEAGIASGVAGPDDPELLLRLANGQSSLLVLGADVRIYARRLATAFGAMRCEPGHASARTEEAHVSA